MYLRQKWIILFIHDLPFTIKIATWFHFRLSNMTIFVTLFEVNIFNSLWNIKIYYLSLCYRFCNQFKVSKHFYLTKKTDRNIWNVLCKRLPFRLWLWYVLVRIVGKVVWKVEVRLITLTNWITTYLLSDINESCNWLLEIKCFF